MKINNLFRTLVMLQIIGITAACNNNTTTGETDGMTEAAEQRESADRSDTELREFAREAASDGIMEVRMAEMAMDKADNDQVKRLAQTIKSEHQSANRELKDIARSAGWDLPDQMMDKHRQKVEDLSETSAENFDREYLQTMVKGHEEAIDKFEKASKRAMEDRQNPDLAAGNDQVQQTSIAEQPQDEGQGQMDRRPGDMGETRTDRTSPNRQDDMQNRGQNTGVNQQLQAWIDNTLPVLRKHLERSRELLDQIEQAS